jgi:hypothetical protein
MLWVAALAMTLGFAVFQRLTGPSYPLRGNLTLGSETLDYRMLRSHGGAGDLPVRIETGAQSLQGTLVWRRYPTQEDWRLIPLRNENGALVAAVPHQPPAGKVEYQVILETESGERHNIPDAETVVARFRGDVPIWILIPHVVAMFTSMLFASRALFEVMRPEPKAGVHVVVAMVLLILGGLILGPTVQKFAFGAFWTGWPFGDDWTDNKTIVAFFAWLPATITVFRRRPLRRSVLLGYLVMMGVFMIPHSYRGSQLDWSDAPAKTGEAIALPEEPSRWR